jgi:hypothetical protein
MKDKIIEILKQNGLDLIHFPEATKEERKNEEIQHEKWLNEIADHLLSLLPLSGKVHEQIDAEGAFYEWVKTATISEDDEGAALVGWVECFHWLKEITLPVKEDDAQERYNKAWKYMTKMPLKFHQNIRKETEWMDNAFKIAAGLSEPPTKPKEE